MPVYQDSIAKELAFVSNHAEVSVIVAEDQEQVDKILALKDQLPALRLVVYEDSRGMSQYTSDWLRSLDRGAGARAARSAPSTPAASRPRSSKGRPDGRRPHRLHLGHHRQPQGRHADPRQRGRAPAQTLIKAEDIRLDDNWLAYLPMAWVGDALYTLVLSLMVGLRVNCPESPETVQRDLRELGPTVGAGAAAHLGEHADRRAGARRRRRPASSAGCSRRSGPPPSGRRSSAPRASRSRSGCACVRALGEFFVYGPVRDQLGLRRARWALTGGAPLGPGHLPLLPLDRRQPQAGVRLHRDDRAGVAAARRRGQSRRPPAGRARASRCKIGDRGEVLVKSPGIFKGYFKNDEATREVIDPEGWFHTGDAGFVDPRGHLVIIDRAKDVGALRRRHRLRAAVHREQAEVQPLHPRGGAPSATSARSSPR